MAKQVHRLPKAPRLAAVLRRLYDAGSRLPVFRVGDTAFGLHAATGRMFVTMGNRRVGTILPSGVFRPSDDPREIDYPAVKVITENPLDVLRMIASVLPEPRCAVCRIPLGTKADRRRGIGKKCYEKGGFARLEKEANAGDRSSSKLRPRRKTRR